MKRLDKNLMSRIMNIDEEEDKMEFRTEIEVVHDLVQKGGRPILTIMKEVMRILFEIQMMNSKVLKEISLIPDEKAVENLWRCKF